MAKWLTKIQKELKNIRLEKKEEVENFLKKNGFVKISPWEYGLFSTAGFTTKLALIVKIFNNKVKITVRDKDIKVKSEDVDLEKLNSSAIDKLIGDTWLTYKAERAKHDAGSL